MRWGGLFAIAGAVALLGTALGAPPPVQAGDEGVEQIVSVLREKGLIDDTQQTQILAKHAAASRKPAGVGAGLVDGLDLNGDFRLRWDSDYHDGDGTGVSAPDRSRFRYRLRIGVKKQISESTSVGFRLVSGFRFNRGQDQELGDSPDFTPDAVQFDRAYIDYAFPETSFGLRSGVVAGKMENPFRWGKGPDTLSVDQDLGFEGVTLKERLNLSENAWLFATAGGYVIQEFASSADPKLMGVQVGAGFRPARDVELGVRASSFFFRSLNSTDGSGTSFRDRTFGGGNLPGAIDNGKTRIGEASTYLTYNGLSAVPLTFFVNVAKNLDAESGTIGGVRVGKEDQAYGFGVQLGDSKRFVSLGFAYFRVEANAVLSQFTDPDFFDGTTNSKGFGIYLERTLADHAFFRVQYYDCDTLDTSGGPTGPFARSIAGHDRRRLQTDLVLVF